MVGFLRQAATIVKGRSFSLPLSWYQTFIAEGSSLNVKMEDLDTYTWFVDFKYSAADEDPIFTLVSDLISPAPANTVVGVTINDSGDIIITVPPEQSMLVEVDLTDSRVDFPFRPLVFEVKYRDPDDVPGSLILGRANVYEGVTTSDE